MTQILYNILITPLELFIEVIYTCSFRIIHNAGVSILTVSLFVNLILLPLYLRADALSTEEMKRQKSLSFWQKYIRNAFEKEERFFRLNSYYREMNYRPIMATYSIIPLLLQIPFFMAAFHFFSNLNELSRNSFWVIGNLSMPDGIIPLPGNNAMNLLPIVMTVFNCLSVYVYSKNMLLKDKLRSYAIALIFLLLLYQSPSGLVLYWTANNLFSLIKNIVISHIPQKNNKQSSRTPGSYTNYSVLVSRLLLLELAILVGGIIPANVIGASVTEMVNIGVNTTPIHYVLFALQVCVGFFVIWGIVVQILIPSGKQSLFTFFLLAITACFLINFYCFPYTGSSLSNALTFLDIPNPISLAYIIRNSIVTFFCSLLVILLWKKYPKLILSVAIALPIISIVFFLQDAIRIHKTSNSWYESHQNTNNQNDTNSILLSRNGKNIIIIGLDRAINNYLPFFFAEKPELYQSFDGFTWYPNTVSFGLQTAMAMPPLMGGYEYTPLKMNDRSEESIINKTNEALRVMPTIFSEAGYHVTVIDPPLANYQIPGDVSIYDDLQNVDAFHMNGYYATPEEKEIASHLLERNTIFYSFYRCAPVILKDYIYDEGRYLNASGALPPSSFIEAHAVLKSLRNISNVTDSDKNCCVILYNNTTHEPALLSAPDYDVKDSLYGYNETIPEKLVLGDQTLYFGKEKFLSTFSAAHYHINMAAYLRLAEYFDYLKQEGVWDNTRIIIVADHGLSLMNFDYLLYQLDDNPQTSDKADAAIDIEAINPLLMVKDFDASGFNVDYSFMTNADVPCIATSGVIADPINPYTLLPLNMDSKDNDVAIPYLLIAPGTNLINRFPTEGSVVLHVHDDIYNEQNWMLTTEPE